MTIDFQLDIEDRSSEGTKVRSRGNRGVGKKGKDLFLLQLMACEKLWTFVNVSSCPRISYVRRPVGFGSEEKKGFPNEQKCMGNVNAKSIRLP